MDDGAYTAERNDNITGNTKLIVNHISSVSTFSFFSLLLVLLIFKSSLLSPVPLEGAGAPPQQLVGSNCQTFAGFSSFCEGLASLICRL